jgi:hypothetical protein
MPGMDAHVRGGSDAQAKRRNNHGKPILKPKCIIFPPETLPFALGLIAFFFGFCDSPRL